MGLDAGERVGPPRGDPVVPPPSWEVLLADGCDVATARHAVRRCLSDVVPEQLVDDAVIVVSELVSNTYSHDSEARALRLSLSSAGVRIEIGGVDPSPVLRGNDASRTVQVLDRLCVDWGVLAEPNRASVAWAVVPNRLS